MTDSPENNPQNQQLIKTALHSDRLVDITTTGACSGQPRTIEIWFHCIQNRFFICGLPGEAHNPANRRPRSWLKNVRANPEILFHLKESLQHALPAQAFAVTDTTVRNMVMTADSTHWYRQQGHDLSDLIENAPMIEIKFPDLD